MLVIIQPPTWICIYNYVMKNMLRMLPCKCPLPYSKPSWFDPLPPKQLTRFFHFHFRFHRVRILDYLWLFCFLTGFSSSWQAVRVLLPQIHLALSSQTHHLQFLIILLLCSNPTVLPIAGFKSSVETLLCFPLLPRNTSPLRSYSFHLTSHTHSLLLESVLLCFCDFTVRLFLPSYRIWSCVIWSTGVQYSKC